MTIELRQADRNDDAFLTEVMTGAFNFDTAFYFGEGEEDGPPGYNDGTLSEKILDNPDFSTYIISDDTIAKGFITIAPTENTVHYFCILPKFINQGVGGAAWKLIEAMYPESSWQVETPSYSLRNHAFYEKFGFEKFAEKKYSGTAKSFLFRQSPK